MSSTPPYESGPDRRAGLGTSRPKRTFSTATGPVGLDAREDVLAALDILLPDWPLAAANRAPVAIVAHQADGTFVVDDLSDGRVVQRSDAAGAAAAIVDCLVARWLRAQQRAVCLHAAGFLTPAGEAVLLHGPTGSGKSTLATLLGAHQQVLVGDDVALVGLDEAAGPSVESAGLAIKMRRPLPSGLPDRAKAYVADKVFGQSPAAYYLRPGRRERLSVGQPVRIAAIVNLIREADPETQYLSDAVLESQPRGEALRALRPSSFAPDLDARQLLSALVAMTEAVPTFRLKFASSPSASRALLERFGRERC